MLGNRRYILGVVLAMVSLVGGTDAASAGTWAPSEAKALILGTDFTIKIGAKEDLCRGTVGEGKLGAKTSTWTFTPEFSTCAFTTTTEGSWTATDVNATEATIQLPKKEKGLVVEISKECHVNIESGPTLGAEKDETNGKNGAEVPSSLTLGPQEVTIKESPAKCVGAAAAVISAHMVFINLTSLAEAITVS